MFKEQKGITLIALVITIIVLLILAGVSIAMISGQDGIATKAQRSVVVTAFSDAKSNITTEASDYLATYYDVKYAGSAGGSTETIGDISAGDYIQGKLENDKADIYAKGITLVIGTKDTTDGSYTLTLKYTDESEPEQTGKLTSTGSISWNVTE